MNKATSKVGLIAAMLLSGTSFTSAQDVSGEVQFTWWGANLRHERVNKIADLFESKHPGAKIGREPQDWARYFERLNVRASAGNMPCVTSMLSFNLNDYAANNLLSDLQPLIDAGKLRVDGIAPGIIDTGRGPDGKLYMLPYGAAPDMLVYNSSLAERSGIEPLSGTYSWNNYFAWLRAAKPKLPSEIFAADYPANYPNPIINYISSNGHDIFKDGKLAFPKEVLVEWWTEWKALSDEGVIIPPDMLSEQPTGHEMTYIATGKGLASLRAANAFGPIQTRLSDASNGDAAEAILFPVGSAGPGDIVPTNGLTIPATCNNVETAAAFIDFFTSDPEATTIFASNNGAVTVASLMQGQLANPDIKAADKKLLEIAKKVAERGSKSAVFPRGFQATFGDTHRRLAQEVLFGTKTPEEAADAFFAELN